MELRSVTRRWNQFSKQNINALKDSNLGLKKVITHGEQVFPRVKEKRAMKDWFGSEDINTLEEVIGRLKRLKDNVGFISNRVTVVQAGLDRWQAETIYHSCPSCFFHYPSSEKMYAGRRRSDALKHWADALKQRKHVF